MTYEELYSIIEQHTFAGDEWGGEKLASWRYGDSVLVDGIDDAVIAILTALKSEAQSETNRDRGH